MPYDLEINSNDRFKRGHAESCPLTTTNIYPLPQCLRPPIMTWWWLNMWGSNPWNNMTPWSRRLARSRDKLKQLYYNSPTRVAMTTKLWRMIVCLGGLVSIMPLVRFITWSCEILWQTKITISLLPHCLWPLNLVGWRHTLRCSKSWMHIVL